MNAGGKIFVLTAAHVVDYQGLLPASFTAAFPGLGATYTGVRFYVHPNWTGDVKDGYDIALVRLDAPVPTRAYDLLRTEISATVIGDLAGFGYSGTGDTGATFPLGTLHQGQNTIGEFFGPCREPPIPMILTTAPPCRIVSKVISVFPAIAVWDLPRPPPLLEIRGGHSSLEV